MLFPILALTTSAHIDHSRAARDLLNLGANAITVCRIVPRADGPHIQIVVRGSGMGNAIEFQTDALKSYDYIFGRERNRPQLIDSALEHSSTLDIPMRRAMGITQDSAEDRKGHSARIFVRPGRYTLYLGYSFRTGEEAMLGGICAITFGGD